MGAKQRTTLAGKTRALCRRADARTTVIQRINSELAKVIALPELRQKLATDGAEPAGGGPEYFQKHIAAKLAKASRVVKAAGIRVEWGAYANDSRRAVLA